MGNLMFFKWIFLYMWCVIFLWMLSGHFSLSLVFSSLSMVCIGLIFFKFILFEIHWDSLICKFIFFIKFGKFSAIIFSNTFSGSTHYASHPGAPTATNVRSLDVIPQVPRLCSFFVNLSFSLSLILDNFYWSSSSLTLSSVFTSPIKPTQWIFYFCNHIFNFNTHLVLFYSFYISAENFYLCICFKGVFLT